jgi:hypothetical protein
MVNDRALRGVNKEAAWRGHVMAQAGGVSSVRAYCATRGLGENSFYWWRRELARRDATRSPTFVPVTVVAQAQTPPPTGDPEGRIEIVLSGDRRVRVTGSVNRQLLSDVVSVLEGRGQAGDVRC